MKQSIARQLLGACVAASLVLPASAASPTPVGSFKNWTVYTSGAGRDRTCYVLSQPKLSDPKGLKRDPVFFLISSWPKRNVRNEPSLVPGYPYKDGTKATVEVGADKFEFFTRNDGGAGGGWMENPTAEKRLITAMSRGATMFVTGTSARGKLTRDQYSLTGLRAALDKVASICK